MQNIVIEDINNDTTIDIDSSWNYATSKELKMHNIHPYPAKFPAFLASKVFEYAKKEGVNINKVADIFCGCGTVSLESQLNDYDFWGCDINPVAVLIANVKSKNYNIKILEKYYSIILKCYEKNSKNNQEIYFNANERLKYWFTAKSYNELYKLKQSIDNNVPKGKYRDVFLCIFSSILKPTSRWLNKSIKPQVDPKKLDVSIIELFQKQYKFLIKSVEENNKKFKNKSTIKRANILTLKKMPKVDLIVTSPPYVTSYEYADLHQLSSLWLGYTKDYKLLRKGTVGSVYNSEDFDLQKRKINQAGEHIISQLSTVLAPSKLKSVARYYMDMELALKKCYKNLNNNGMIFFVVGDTEYKSVKIENSKHLVKALYEIGFKDVKIARRKISNKLLTPYRDNNGKFTSDKTKRTIYYEEFLISGRKF